MPDNQKLENIDGVIELAMSRLAERTPASVAADDRKQQERLDLGRRDYDVALANRLEELRKVMGNSASVMPPAAQLVAAAEPALPRRGFRIGTLLVTALLSSIAGAGAMWLAIGGNPPLAAAPAPVGPIAPILVPAPSEPSDDDRVRELIENWRSAWADRNVDAYLACYSADFTPANGQKHDAWAAARRKNISSRGSIVVATNDPQFERIDAQRLKVRFLQDYASGGYRETAQAKTLLLVRDEAGWKIVGEWQGDAPTSALGKP